MGTTSQTTVSGSTALTPRQLVDRLVTALGGRAEASTGDDGTTLLLPPTGQAIGDSPVGSVHLKPGTETLMLDCTAPDSGQLERIEALVASHLRSVDAGAADALAWRRHE